MINRAYYTNVYYHTANIAGKFSLQDKRFELLTDKIVHACLL